MFKLSLFVVLMIFSLPTLSDEQRCIDDIQDKDILSAVHKYREEHLMGYVPLSIEDSWNISREYCQYVYKEVRANSVTFPTLFYLSEGGEVVDLMSPSGAKRTEGCPVLEQKAVDFTLSELLGFLNIARSRHSDIPRASSTKMFRAGKAGCHFVLWEYIDNDKKGKRRAYSFNYLGGFSGVHTFEKVPE